MNNQEILNKLTLGIQETEKVEVEFEDGKSETFEMRLLTDGELSELKTLESTPYRMKLKMNTDGKVESVERREADTNMDMNLNELNRYQSKVLYNAVAWSLSVNGSEISSNTIRALPKGVPEALFTEVIRMNRLTDEDLKLIKNFR